MYSWYLFILSIPSHLSILTFSTAYSFITYNLSKLKLILQMTKQMLTWNHEPEIFILKFGITTSKSQIVNLKSQIITQAHRLVHPDKNKILDHLPAML